MKMKPLSPQQIREYRAQAHSLKPVVLLGGKGLTDAVLAEIDNALNHHELIKVKIPAEREERQHIARDIADKMQAELIQTIGQIAVFYRKAPE